jgi:hypothetical protein
MTDDDSDLLQFKPLAYGVTADSASISNGLTPTTAKLDVTERVRDLMRGGKCFRQKVALSLLGNASDGLKFAPVHFD